MARTVLAMILLAATASAAGPLNQTWYTLYSDGVKLSWQNAVEFCRERNQSLISPATIQDTDILNSLALQAEGQPWYNKIQDLWISLHDPDKTTPGAGYQWLQWSNSCVSLGGYSNWAQGQPLNTDVNLCVKASWSATTGFRWATESCVNPLRVMCVSSDGPCKSFSSKNNTAVASDQSLALVTDATTDTACTDLCRSTVAFGLDCWAAEWTPAFSSCTLRLSNRPFAALNLTTVNGSTTFLPSCNFAVFNGNVTASSSTSSAVFASSFPCNESSATSTTIPETSGTSRAALKMTYFPVMTSWYTARNVCQSLTTSSSQAYLVMPKDVATQEALITFLRNSTTTRVWLGVNYTSSSLYWADGTLIRPSGNYGTSPSSACVSGTYQVSSGLVFGSENCSRQESAIVCQKIENDHCTFQEFPGKAVSSDWILGPVKNVSECLDHCNSYLYKGLECWAVTLDNRTSKCYLLYASVPPVQAENSSIVLRVRAKYLVLFIRYCFTLAEYDFSSTVINRLLYHVTSQSVMTSELSSSGYVASTVELNATQVEMTTDLVEWILSYYVEDDVETANILATAVLDETAATTQSMTQNASVKANLTAVTGTADATTSVTQAAGRSSISTNLTTTAGDVKTSAVTSLFSATSAAAQVTVKALTATKAQSEAKTSGAASVTSTAAVRTTHATDATNATTQATAANFLLHSSMETGSSPSASSTGLATSFAPSTKATESLLAATANFSTATFQNVQPYQESIPGTPTSGVVNERSSASGLLGTMSLIIQTPVPAKEVTTAADGTKLSQTNSTLSVSEHFNQTSTAEHSLVTVGTGSEGTAGEFSMGMITKTSGSSDVTASASAETSSSSGSDGGTRQPILCACTTPCAHRAPPQWYNASASRNSHELLVNQRMTSRQWRKLNSVPDDRPSARMLGSMGTAIIVGVVSFLLGLDLCSAARGYAQRRQ